MFGLVLLLIFILLLYLKGLNCFVLFDTRFINTIWEFIFSLVFCELFEFIGILPCHSSLTYHSALPSPIVASSLYQGSHLSIGDGLQLSHTIFSLYWVSCFFISNESRFYLNLNIKMIFRSSLLRVSSHCWWSSYQYIKCYIVIYIYIIILWAIYITMI